MKSDIRDPKAERDDAPKRIGFHAEQPDGMGFDNDCSSDRRVGVTQFDYGAVEKESIEEMDDLRVERELFLLFGSLWAEVMEWVHVPKDARLVGLRFKAVIYCCRPQMLGDNTQQKIAQAEGITKQTFQNLTRKFRDTFKVMCRSMRSEAACKKMQEAALKIHAKKRAGQNLPTDPDKESFS